MPDPCVEGSLRLADGLGELVDSNELPSHGRRAAFLLEDATVESACPAETPSVATAVGAALRGADLRLGGVLERDAATDGLYLRLGDGATLRVETVAEESDAARARVGQRVVARVHAIGTTAEEEAFLGVSLVP